MKVNFYNHKELFEWKFKRVPKIWTVEQIHDLWLRAEERGSKKYADSSAYIQEIVKEIPKNERGEHVVYFYHRRDNSLCKYSLSYHRDWKCYGISQGHVEFSKDKVAGRDEKITFLLTNQRAFEMGQRYHELDGMKSNLQYRVKAILWQIIEDKLRDHYKKLDTNPPDVFTINIGDYKYYVKTDEQHRHGWLKFHWGGEVIDESIKIE